MSTWDGCFIAPNPDYTRIGPGLCAANMRYAGWLDESRVWKASTNGFTQQIILRPLHARGLPGFLAAEVPGTAGGFLVEFRVPEDWDTAFPRAAVFVHRLQDGHSYRMIGSTGSSDLVEGDKYNFGVQPSLVSSFTSVQVDEINEGDHFAKVTLTYSPPSILHVPSLVGVVTRGVEVDGGGVIYVNGHPHPVDPWGPLTGVLTGVVAHGSADQISDPAVRLAAKKSALASIVRIATDELEDLTHLETPPALSKGGRHHQT
jgi:hypothetical protein